MDTSSSIQNPNVVLHMTMQGLFQENLEASSQKTYNADHSTTLKGKGELVYCRTISGDWFWIV